jgi:hypothetical protein
MAKKSASHQCGWFGPQLTLISNACNVLAIQFSTGLIACAVQCGWFGHQLHETQTAGKT